MFFYIANVRENLTKKQLVSSLEKLWDITPLLELINITTTVKIQNTKNAEV